MRKDKNQLDNLLCALSELEDALQQYETALKELVESGASAPSEVMMKARDAVRAFDAAVQSRTRFSLGVLQPWFARMQREVQVGVTLNEQVKRVVVEGADESAVAFAGAVTAASAPFVAIPGYMYTRVKTEVFREELELPTPLHDFKKVRSRAKWWLLVLGPVAVVLGFVGIIPYVVIAIAVAVLGLVGYLVQKYYVSERYFLAGLLPTGVSAEVREELNRLADWLPSLHNFSQSLLGVTFTWPDSLTQTIRRLADGQVVAEAELQAETRLAIKLHLALTHVVEALRPHNEHDRQAD